MSFSFDEVAQIWQNEKGREYIIARSCFPHTFYYDCWSINSKLTLKGGIKNTYYGIAKYEINPSVIYNRIKLLPILKRNGLKTEFFDISPSALTKALLRHNDAEYLLKSNQIELLRYMVNRNISNCPYKKSVNICNRNKYVISDASKWVDMMSALDYINKDLHNPKFICPKDISCAHDSAIFLRRNKQIKLDKEKQRQMNYEYNKNYIIAKKNYFDLVISNQNIIITVLKNINEFEKEGNDLRHCVYTNQYFNKKNSLIMSAKDNDGNRIETIELSLDTYKILQSRGKNNSISSFHDEIISLIEKNIDKIIDRKSA